MIRTAIEDNAGLVAGLVQVATPVIPLALEAAAPVISFGMKAMLDNLPAVLNASAIAGGTYGVITSIVESHNA